MRRAALLAGLGALVFLFQPACPFHALTGLLCPGCGGTRALMALATGHLVDAVRCNAFVILAIPFVLLRLRSEEFIPVRCVPYLLAVATAFGVARNL